MQGEKAAGEVAAAIAGFNRLPMEGPVPRPDVLIVARGGGSLEDLWAFNEEIVVRAAAASTIPLISAVGHETDTTLIDFASDRRAPTPTAAAEMAVPVRADLLAQTLDFGQRTMACMTRALREASTELAGLARGLGDPLRLIEERQQRLDVSGERLALATRALVERRGHELERARLTSPRRGDQRQGAAAGRRGARARRRDAALQGRRAAEDRARLRSAGAVRRAPAAAFGDLLAHGQRQVDQLGKLLESYSFHSVLNRGFALVRDQDGQPVLAAAGRSAGDTIGIEFGDGGVRARVSDGTGAAPRPARRAAQARRRQRQSGIVVVAQAFSVRRGLPAP